MIEKVLVKKTLKAGDDIWVEGALIDAPIPNVLLDEIHLGTGTVEIVGQSPGNSPSDKLIFVAERVEEKAGPGAKTLTSMSMPAEPPVPPVPPVLNKPKYKVVKPKPLLKRRKK